MKWSLLTLLLFPLLVQANLRATEVLKAMARFDEGFVPLWVHVQEGRWCEAEEDIFRLEFHWQRLLHNYLAGPGRQAPPDWACAADQDLGSAYRAIDAGRLDEAARLLDAVRRALQDYRQAQGLIYYLDPWWIAWDAARTYADAPSAERARRAAAALETLSKQDLCSLWAKAEVPGLEKHQEQSAALAGQLGSTRTIHGEALLRHLLKGLAILGRVEEDGPRFASS